MVEHRNLEETTNKMGIITASDHSPVMLKIRLMGESSGKGTWRINEDLIEDREMEKTITEEIKKYFQENYIPELSKATIWEAHKTVIRGTLISIGAGKKKERRKKMVRTIEEIHELEQRHKKQVEKEIYRTLILKREQLKEWMEQGEEVVQQVITGEI